jgi:hypothetical protein
MSVPRGRPPGETAASRHARPSAHLSRARRRAYAGGHLVPLARATAVLVAAPDRDGRSGCDAVDPGRVRLPPEALAGTQLIPALVGEVELA